MKYVEEFRDGQMARTLAAKIAAEVRPDRRYHIMEFCGGHTHAIFRYGVQDLLPPGVCLIHGPGCPVCVLPIGRIDNAVELAGKEGVILCTYGDLLRVPGSNGMSLLRAKADGADVRMVYSTLDALRIAADNPDRQVIFFAIGFETTTPPTAIAIKEAKTQKLANFSVFCNHVLTPAAIVNILESPEVRKLGTIALDAFLGPAHVSAVIGSRPFEFFAEEYQRPVVIAGFEPLDVMQSVLMLIPQRLQDEEINIIARIKAGERVANYETTRMRKDGTLFDVSLTISPVKTRDGRIVGASKIARDITATKEHERRIKLLMREVNHRVKNQYAVMLAMVKETSRRAANPEEFERNVRERILALSRSHDLLVMSKWSGATLDELVREHLKPFGHEEQIALSGPALTLNSRAVQYLGMAFHELGTNSAKYGALSDGAGSVQVNWAIATSAAGGRELRLCWEENVGRNIPPASEKGHRGFGSVVLQRVTPQALGGTAVLVRESAQVRWELRAPIDGVTVEDEQAEEPAISQASFTDPG